MREDSKVAGIIVNRLTKPDMFVKEDIMTKISRHDFKWIDPRHVKLICNVSSRTANVSGKVA